MHGSLCLHQLDHRFPAHAQRAPEWEQSNAADAQRRELYFRALEFRSDRRNGAREWGLSVDGLLGGGNELSRERHAAKPDHVARDHELSCQLYSRPSL